MVKTDRPFAFFEDGFDGPAQAAEAHELSRRGLGWGITEVELEHRRISEIAPD